MRGCVGEVKAPSGGMPLIDLRADIFSFASTASSYHVHTNLLKASMNSLVLRVPVAHATLGP